MTPEELRKKAFDASSEEFKKIEKEVNAAAEKGMHSLEYFEEISDGAIAHLKSKGFKVEKKNKYFKGVFNRPPQPYILIDFSD